VAYATPFDCPRKETRGSCDPVSRPARRPLAAYAKPSRHSGESPFSAYAKPSCGRSLLRSWPLHPCFEGTTCRAPAYAMPSRQDRDALWIGPRSYPPAGQDPWQDNDFARYREPHVQPPAGRSSPPCDLPSLRVPRGADRAREMRGKPPITTCVLISVGSPFGCHANRRAADYGAPT
jgi:hypothetical protein